MFKDHSHNSNAFLSSSIEGVAVENQHYVSVVAPVLEQRATPLQTGESGAAVGVVAERIKTIR